MNETPPTPPTDENGEDTGKGGADRDPRRPRQLLRSSNDKMLGGVAGGLAEYFNLDPVLIRVAFAITGLMGIGILAYLALYIFVPEDDGWGNPVQARDRDRLIAGGLIVLLLIAIPGGLFPLASLDWWWGLSAAVFWLTLLGGIGYGVYWMLSGGSRTRNGIGSSDAGSRSTSPGGGFAKAAPGTPATPGDQSDPDQAQTAVMPTASPASTGRGASLARVLLMIALGATLAVFSLGLAATAAWGAAVGGVGVIAVIVILCGVLIALASFKRPMRWLIVPALALALPAAAVEASGFELDGGYGDRVIRPARLADIPDDGYRMAAGNMTIDLRQADWRPGSKVELPAKLNFGRLAVVVPDDVCVASDIEVWAGGFEVLGESDSDFRVQYRRTLPESATPQLHLDGDVDIGWVEVLTRMPDENFRDRHGLTDPDAAQPAHCLQEDGSAKRGDSGDANRRSTQRSDQRAENRGNER